MADIPKRRAHLLYVDDNPADAKLVSDHFLMGGHVASCRWLATVQEAIVFLKTASPKSVFPRPDVILLDLNLGISRGTDLLTFIRNTPELCTIPVIIFSTSELEEDVIECYRKGANCYLLK